jgi:uncharacterized protein with HEPN domain
MKKLDPDIVRLSDILQAVTDIEDYKLTTLSLKKDIHAVCYNIAIIGEASGRLSSGLQQKYHEISWQQITGIRHKVIHDYGKVDVAVLQNVITEKLPMLKKQIKMILADLTR